jgi:hypothetical protein
MGDDEKIVIKLYYHGDKEQRFVNIKCKDLAKFEDVQNFAAKHVSPGNLRGLWDN